jgi:hypothetical protein
MVSSRHARTVRQTASPVKPAAQRGNLAIVIEGTGPAQQTKAGANPTFLITFRRCQFIRGHQEDVSVV